MSELTTRALNWTEQGLVPDNVIRLGIRRLLERKRAEIRADDVEHATLLENRFVELMNESPVALVPERANEQHYEVPAEFFNEVLGARRKYSCAYWPRHVTSLDAAELAALEVTAERADVRNGMTVLDLGCGWGSLSLYLAERMPDCRITAVSNSESQKAYIDAQAKSRSLENLRVRVADMNDFDPGESFDRVVSVEMFEHMRNWGELFRRIAGWLRPEGLFFMHVFCHRTTPYEFVDKGPGDWMSRQFFSGGIMPSAGLPLRFADDLVVEQRWFWEGSHYAKTCEGWLRNMDERADRVLPILGSTYGVDSADRWRMRWRMFFMACAELFTAASGTEWHVAHYRLRRAER